MVVLEIVLLNLINWDLSEQQAQLSYKLEAKHVMIIGVNKTGS